MTLRARNRKSFTLIELMVVVAIASVIMGIGVGAYLSMNKNLTWRASVSMVTSLLHAARNSASETRTAVSVVIKTEPTEHADRMLCSQVYATFVRCIGAWHFEEPNTPFDTDTVIEGAFSQEATPANMDGSGLVAGKYGKAIRFERWTDDDDPDSAPHPPQKLTIGKEGATGSYPAYDVREGLRISAWVKPELPPDVQDDSRYYYPIVVKPWQQDASLSDISTLPVYSITLVLDPDADKRVFRLSASVRLESGWLYDVETNPMVRPDTWTHVAMVYSGTDTAMGQDFLRVYINDEEAVLGRGLKELSVQGEMSGPSPLSKRVLASDEAVMIGADEVTGIGGNAEEGYFHGTIDEVMIDVFTTAERTAPRGSVLMSFSNCPMREDGDYRKYRIDFDREGRLVIPQGGGLPVIALHSTGSKVTTHISVERTGAIKTWTTTENEVEEP
ncbi:MAG: prepilin-type N-terminal cleavage/methylation domain-containing protein [Planctomycetes bacterium]|nr:prepilin-type N-terminal cleavage/methylation domain-containing protein [Planctomycetota bacterium]